MLEKDESAEYLIAFNGRKDWVPEHSLGSYSSAKTIEAADPDLELGEPEPEDNGPGDIGDYTPHPQTTKARRTRAKRGARR